MFDVYDEFVILISSNKRFRITQILFLNSNNLVFLYTLAKYGKTSGIVINTRVTLYCGIINSQI